MNEDKTSDHEMHDLFDALREAIKAYTPAGRAQALALTKLDECGLWCGAAKEQGR